MTEYKIEKNVPYVRNSNGIKGASKYPFKHMEVGDSFFVPCGNATSRRLMQRLSAATFRAHGNTGFKFSIRTDSEGVRVWRTA